MKLKNTLKILSVTLLLASCNDWLDVAPKDKILEDQQFSSEDNIYSATNGLYRELTGEHLYGGQLSQTTIELLGHMHTYPAARPSEGDQSMPNYTAANFEYTHDNLKARFANVWKKAYESLLHINTYIKNLEASTALRSERNKKILLGEAYAMRAWIHFDIFRLFGPIYQLRNETKILPYHNRADIILNQDNYEAKVYLNADQYLNQVKTDINRALQLLEENDPIIDDPNSISNTPKNDNFFQNRNRRMNYYAVKGLEARFLQYTGQDNQAAIAAKVITDAVGTRFKWVNIANIVREHNYILFSEIIFGLNNIDMSARGKTWYDGTDLRTGYLMDKNNLLTNILNYQGTILSSIRDIRAYQWTQSKAIPSLASYSVDGTYISLKFQVNTVYLDVPAIKELQPLMRISEMYYIQAENEMKTGNLAAAINLLNLVLEKRNLTVASFLPDNATEMMIRDHIEKEYYREFYGEGQVFFYHKRLMSATMFRGNGAGRDAVEPASYVVPIPDAEKNI